MKAGRQKAWFRISPSLHRRAQGVIDRVLSALMLLGAVAQIYGALTSYGVFSEILVWSLAGGLTMLLLAALNFLRASRPDDKALAWICLVGCVGWAAIAIAFGTAIGHLFDPRVVFQTVVALALADMSFVTACKKTAVTQPQISQAATTPPDEPVGLPQHVSVRAPFPIADAAYRASRSHKSQA